MLDKFTWYKQSTFRWKGEKVVVYIDSWGLTDGLPPADLILITHAHGDHFVPEDIARHLASQGQDVSRAALEHSKDMAAHNLFAGALQHDIVPAQVEAKMLEPKQSRQPVGAAYSLNPKNLTAQIFRCFDRRSGNHIVGHFTAKRRQDSQVRLSNRRPQDTAAAAIGDWNGSRLHCGDHQRCIADKNEGRVDPILLEVALLLGNP